MATLYENLLGGTITDNPLSSGATTINSAAFASLPVVTGGDIMYLTLDPAGTNGAPEIVTVTGHTASATSVTVTRASQDTSARSHPTATSWVHGLTEADIDVLAALVDTDRIADNAITNSKLDTDAVDEWKIADNVINSEHYVDGSIDTVHLADGAVTAPKASFGWTSWTPTFTETGSGYSLPDVGNGTWNAKYLRIGNVGWISAMFTLGSTTTINSRSVNINLPSGWTASGPAVGLMYQTRTTSTNDYQMFLTVGDGLGYYQADKKGTNTVVTSWMSTTTTNYIVSQYAYSIVSNDGDTISYSIGPIPLV